VSQCITLITMWYEISGRNEANLKTSDPWTLTSAPTHLQWGFAVLVWMWRSRSECPAAELFFLFCDWWNVHSVHLVQPSLCWLVHWSPKDYHHVVGWRCTSVHFGEAIVSTESCRSYWTHFTAWSNLISSCRQYSKNNGNTRPPPPGSAWLDSCFHHRSALDVLQLAAEVNPRAFPRQVHKSMALLRRLGRPRGAHAEIAPSEARFCCQDWPQHCQLERSPIDKDHIFDQRRVSQGTFELADEWRTWLILR